MRVVQLAMPSTSSFAEEIRSEGLGLTDAHASLPGEAAVAASSATPAIARDMGNLDELALNGERPSEFVRALMKATGANGELGPSSNEQAAPPNCSTVGVGNQCHIKRAGTEQWHALPADEDVAPDGLHTFYLGTKADLKVGDLVRPSRSPRRSKPVRAGSGQLTTTLDAAIWVAESSEDPGYGRVYIIETTGPVENITVDAVADISGTPTNSYRSLGALHVIGEISGWQGIIGPMGPALYKGKSGRRKL